MSNTRSTEEAPAAAAGELAALVEAVRGAERQLARAVVLAGRLAASGVSERVEGLPLEQFLGLAARLTGADRRMIVTAGEVLADLPVVTRLFCDAAISWGQVRAIVQAARRLPAADRTRLDDRVAATVAERGDVDAFDPDQLVWAVDAAAEELRGARAVERAEQRRAEANFVSVQAALDGGVRIFAELDAVAGAPVLNALDAAAGRPAATGSAVGPAQPGADAGGPGGGVEELWVSSSRARQYAEGLTRVCADWLGGAAGRPARPLLVAHVDLSQTSLTAAGTVELAVRGGLPRITAAAAEALAADADVRAVLFDGARPLAVAAKVNAAAVPAATRVAVAARDLGCRFPGSADPPAHCDVHHLVERRRGGGHHPDNLVALSRRHHTIAHRHGWALSVAPDTGEVTARRGERRWRSLPRGTPLTRPPRNPEPADPNLPF